MSFAGFRHNALASVADIHQRAIVQDDGTPHITNAFSAGGEQDKLVVPILRLGVIVRCFVLSGQIRRAAKAGPRDAESARNQ
jgi:hypothetical protein